MAESSKVGKRKIQLGGRQLSERKTTGKPTGQSREKRKHAA